MNFSLDECRLIDLPQILNPKGNLTFVEAGRHVPFEIQRVYYLYDVPGGAQRGGHAHKALTQLIIAMSGSFDVVLDDGRDKKRIHLNRSYTGLFICLVLASNKYDESDYYREYAEFISAKSRA
jgi:hypothetical protein